MSFVSRLFSKPSSSSLAAAAADGSAQEEGNTSIKSNGTQQSPKPPPQPLRPLGSILRQPSPPGEARNGQKQQQHETRRVSFSSDPVRVTTIPANPPRASGRATSYQQMDNNKQHNRVLSGHPRQQQSRPPSSSNNGSWFRSLFSSPAKTGENNSSVDEKSSFRPLNNTELLENIPLTLTEGFNGKQQRLTDWEKGKQSLDELPEAALDVIDNIDLISSQEQLEDGLTISDSLPSSSSFQLVQPKPFKLDSRKVGLLMFNKDGVCGFNSIKSKPLELTLKKLLVQNIMDEVPTPKTATNPLLRTRASPQSSKLLSEVPLTVTTTMSAESRSKTDKTHIRGVDLNKLEIDVFYSTISEMIFGAISIAQKPVKSMIDAEYANGAKLLAFKLHYLGTDWHDDSDPQKAEDLFITSFIIDAKNANPRINGLPIQCGVAILWLCPHSTNTSVFSSGTNSVPPGLTINHRSAELTLYNLLFNTPGFLMNILQLFAYDLLNLGISSIRTCFYWMLYRLVDFMNAVRLKGDLDEEETIDSLVHLIQRYDNKEHCFFISNLLSTIFSFSYKQDRFKVVLWTSQPEQLPMMCQVVTLINQFMVKLVHKVSDEMVINSDYQFVIPETLRTDFETEDTEQASDANHETEFFHQPVPGSSCSSTLSTVTAIQVQTGGRTVLAESINQVIEPSTSIISQSQPNGLHNYCSKSERKSRDESIGYNSLSESAISGNTSPVNSEEMVFSGDEDQRSTSAFEQEICSEHTVHNFMTFQKIKQQRQQHQKQQKQQQEQSDALRTLLNVSQTTDYEESESGAFARSSDTDTTASGDENMNRSGQGLESVEHYSVEEVSAGSINQINKTKQNYFRGYVDLRYKDGEQEETDEQESSNKIELTLADSVVTDATTSQHQFVDSAMQATSTTTAMPKGNYLQSSLPLSIASSSSTSSNVFSLKNSPESHAPVPSCSATTTAKPAATPSDVMEIHSTPFGTVSLTSQGATDEPHFANLKPSKDNCSLSASASALYHFSWLSLPVISCQHLDLLTTQVILGETLQQASARAQQNTEGDNYPETYEFLLSRLSEKLKEEESNDTVFLVNCDTMEMHLLERALSEPCGPVMSSYLANACERVLSLATTEGRQYDVWQYLRYTLTHLMLKSEVLQSVLVHDLHLLMKNRSVKRKGDDSSVNNNNDLLDIYINEETKEYAHKVWAELMGDQTVNVYLTSDGPKAAFDLFRFRAPTSALYLFSDNNLSHFYLPSSVTTRLLDFDSSDLLVIVGLRKLFLRSREPLITAMHGRENAKIFNYLLKYPQFSKNNQHCLKSKSWSYSMTNLSKSCPLYKTIAFNMLLVDVLSSQFQSVSSFKTTFFSSNKKKQSERKSNNVRVDQNVL